ncbi:MAG: P1 family peptidase [Beijerinckiaceae bacterium]|nr:P1 family peptidase [Beijerinckiaceae bacterium]MCZ8301881.1 P1 family peptidase [Beijerinckiaceae bacterium]
MPQTRSPAVPVVPAGLAIGHAGDESVASGVTALVFAEPATAAVAVLGGAPGGRDTALLAPEMTVEQVDALLLSGGSAFGLDAAGGAMAALAAAGRGFPVGPMRVPIVPQAILFDLLNGGNKVWDNPPPYWEWGRQAVLTAEATTPEGSVGAGLGATLANLKGGFGTASATTRNGIAVQAFIAVNAIGVATIGETGRFWAAPFEQGDEFGGQGWPLALPKEAIALRIKGHAAEPATTIGAVVTDARLTKAQAHRLALMAHDGLARAIRPAHAAMDGDTLFAAATGRQALADPLRDLTELGMLAADCVARAIARAVYHARALPFPGALPDWQTRFGGETGA